MRDQRRRVPQPRLAGHDHAVGGWLSASHHGPRALGQGREAARRKAVLGGVHVVARCVGIEHVPGGGQHVAGVAGEPTNPAMGNRPLSRSSRNTFSGVCPPAARQGLPSICRCSACRMAVRARCSVPAAPAVPRAPGCARLPAMSRRTVEVTPELLLRAYRVGLFPMAETRHGNRLYWLDPEHRGVLPLDRFHLPRRLLRTVLRGPYSVTADTNFPAVIAACAAAAPGREDTWINRDIERLFGDLHRAGLAHSVECRVDGVLVGGLNGVSLGGAFFARACSAPRGMRPRWRCVPGGPVAPGPLPAARHPVPHQPPDAVRHGGGPAGPLQGFCWQLRWTISARLDWQIVRCEWKRRSRTMAQAGHWRSMPRCVLASWMLVALPGLGRGATKAGSRAAMWTSSRIGSMGPRRQQIPGGAPDGVRSCNGMRQASACGLSRSGRTGLRDRRPPAIALADMVFCRAAFAMLELPLRGGDPQTLLAGADACNLHAAARAHVIGHGVRRVEPYIRIKLDGDRMRDGRWDRVTGGGACSNGRAGPMQAVALIGHSRPGTERRASCAIPDRLLPPAADGGPMIRLLPAGLSDGPASPPHMLPSGHPSCRSAMWT